jgi:hypothetical protein
MTDSLQAVVAEAHRQGFDNRTIADKLNLSLTEVIRITGGNKVGSLISMADFTNTKKLLDDMAAISAGFADEYGQTLDDLGRRTVFFGSEGKPFIRPGDPEHAAIWKRHEVALVQETAHLVRAMKGARFSVWCAALRIVGIKQGIKIPLRPSDWDPDEPGQI